MVRIDGAQAHELRDGRSGAAAPAASGGVGELPARGAPPGAIQRHQRREHFNHGLFHGFDLTARCCASAR